jgi:N-acetylglucosamine-6-phosphate deacetylase
MGRELTRRGILASIAHSDAEYPQVAAAWDAGNRHVTHLYSGMSTVHRRNAYRYAGVVGSRLLIDGMTVEIIADGCHLPAELLRLVCRFKGPGSTALVYGHHARRGHAGRPHMLGHREHAFPSVIEDGVAKLPDPHQLRRQRGHLRPAGAQHGAPGGRPLTDAVQMATRTPARIMRLEDRGAIAEGLRADLVLFDEAIHVSRTIVGRAQRIRGKRRLTGGRRAQQGRKPASVTMEKDDLYGDRPTPVVRPGEFRILRHVHGSRAYHRHVRGAA